MKFKYRNESDFTSHKNAVKLSDEAVQELIDDVTKSLENAIKRNDELCSLW